MVDFFSNESYPKLDIKSNDLPFASLSKDSRDYIFADLSNVRSEMFTYYASVSQFNSGKIDWKILCKPEDMIVRGREIIKNDIYAITERPDLYAAAICNVGCANAMRMETAPNGPANIPGFGTVKDSVECKALYEMDGVAHVKKERNTRL